MSYVIVVRNTELKQSRVYEGPDLPKLLERIRLEHAISERLKVVVQRKKASAANE